MSNLFLHCEPDERLSSRVWNGEDVGQESVVGHPGQKGHLFLASVLSVLSSPPSVANPLTTRESSERNRKIPKQTFFVIEEEQFDPT